MSGSSLMEMVVPVSVVVLSMDGGSGLIETIWVGVVGYPGVGATLPADCGGDCRDAGPRTC